MVTSAGTLKCSKVIHVILSKDKEQWMTFITRALKTAEENQMASIALTLPGQFIVFRSLLLGKIMCSSRHSVFSRSIGNGFEGDQYFHQLRES
jgi:hypothetical protein